MFLKQCYRGSGCSGHFWECVLTFIRHWVLQSDILLVSYLCVCAEDMTLHLIHGVHPIGYRSKMEASEHHFILGQSPCGRHSSTRVTFTVVRTHRAVSHETFRRKHNVVGKYHHIV